MYKSKGRINHMIAYLPPEEPKNTQDEYDEDEEEDYDEDKFIPEPLTEKKYLCGEKLLKQIKKEQKKNRINPNRLSKRLSSIVKIF